MATIEHEHAHTGDGPEIAHHFDSLEQQMEAGLLGMWIFLVTEVMFFGGVFTAYIVYRVRNFEAFAQASHHLDVPMGTINTCVLLVSSLTMALAVDAAHHRNRNKTIGFLITTAVLGTVFLVVKGFEYAHKYHEHHMPLFGLPFVWDDPATANGAELYFGLYFGMTAIHAIHMIIGLVIIAVICLLVRRGKYVDGNYMPIEAFGLYWHFVDIVWIFLFPFLYLIGLNH